MVLFSVLSTVAALVFAGFFILLVGDEEKPAGAQVKRLAAAIEAGKPSPAPKGTGGYVEGVREAFGPVREAQPLEEYRKRVETAAGDGQYRTYSVTEILITAKRGAAVLELEHDGDRIAGVREVAPGDVHFDLDERTQDALTRGYAQRGAKPAKSLVLDGTFLADGGIRDAAPRPAAPKPKPVAKPKKVRIVSPELECVQQAKGDVEKLQKCAQ